MFLIQSQEYFEKMYSFSGTLIKRNLKFSPAKNLFRVFKTIERDCVINLINDTHREKLCFTQFGTRMAVWLFLTFFICLHT